MEWKLERQLLGGIYSSSTGDCNNNLEMELYFVMCNLY